MNIDQGLAVALIVVMMAAFVWGRFRYDLVAASALVCALALGLVEPKAAFSGFSDDIVIIVASALIISGAISRSGITDVALRRVSPEKRGPRVQLLMLVVVVAVLSAFIKNIGALAMMIPVAIHLARKSAVSPSMFLMPMAFASLLGGLMTQIGTSPNIIVSRVREEIGGTAFTMFDYTPVGAALTLVGVVFLVFFYRLLPARKRENAALHEAIAIKNYTTEAVVTQNTLAPAATVAKLQKFADGDAMVTSIIGESGAKRKPLPDTNLKLGDVLLLEGPQDALDKLVNQGRLKLSSHKEAGNAAGQDRGSVEAIVGKNSHLIGLSAKELSLFARTGVDLLAISRRDMRLTERLGEIRIQNGDVLVLQGDLQTLPDMLRQWDCLPLVERTLHLGRARNGLLPVGILAVAMMGTAFFGVPVAAAFFAAAVAIVATGSLPPREVYGHLDAPILLMLAALIPVSDALRTTGTTDVIADFLSRIAVMLPSYGALALILVAAMAVTPFLNNAATVLVMAPIAATFAEKLGLQPDAFLMAVAIGAGCDFLTPIGHQCNTLVMGPGGYRFGDYWRLGLPLSVLIVLVSVPLLLIAWPL